MQVYDKAGGTVRTGRLRPRPPVLISAGVYSFSASMPYFWKTGDGRWRKGTVAWFVLFLVCAIYDFIREGWGSLSEMQYLLLAGGAAALAPAEHEPQEARLKGWKSYVFGSPRYMVGAVALVAAAAILVYRVARDIGHR